MREESTEDIQVYVNSKKRLRKCADIFGSERFLRGNANKQKGKIYAFNSNFAGLHKCLA